MAEQVKKGAVTVVKDMEEFHEYLENAGGKLVVVDFYAQWCGPCKMIAPHLEKMAEQLKDKVIFLKVDVDECDDIAVEQGIEAMPTFAFFKDKQKVHVFVGANLEKLRDDVMKQMNEQVVKS